MSGIAPPPPQGRCIAGRPAGARPWHALAAALWAWVLLGLPLPALALDVALVLSQSGGPHRAFADALQASLRPGSHRLVPAGSVDEGIDAKAVAAADLVIASGAAAVESVLRDHRRPTLAVLIGATQFDDLKARHPRAEATAVVLDQPVERYLRLIAAVLPAQRQLGVLLGPDSGALEASLEAAARKAGMELSVARLEQGEHVVGALEGVLAGSGALLALPDSVVSSPAAARTILLTSYRFRRPIFAFSAAYVEAGALAAVFSTPEHVAHDVADWLHRARPGRAAQSPVMHPVRFGVAVNRQVARALNLAVPAERDLVEQAIAREESR